MAERLESRRLLTFIDIATLAPPTGFYIKGVNSTDATGAAVSGAGDVNGDGFEDMLVGAPGAGGNSVRDTSGDTYLVFGAPGLGEIDLAQLGNRGVVIHGADPGDSSGLTVSKAGDVNGDGLDDLLIGAQYAAGANNSRGAAGDAYIVYGRRSYPTEIDLEFLGQNGITILGGRRDDRMGNSVAAAGDVNGDGLSDVIIGAYYGNSGPQTDSPGKSYLLLGSQTLPSVIDLAVGNGQIVRIDGADAQDQSGISVSGGGDVNGDGLSDLIIGSWLGDGTTPTNSNVGEAHIVFGRKVFPALLNLGSLGATGVLIGGIDSSDEAGRAVSNAGDVNGDGYDDVLIGARMADASGNAKPYAGEAYIVFGGKTLPPTIELATLASGGITLFGASGGDYVGWSVSGGGDINGDGYDDIVIGAPSVSAGTPQRYSNGVAYVLFGGAGLPSQIDLSTAGAVGVVAAGPFNFVGSGEAVAMAGDVDGDGLDEAMIGGPSAGQLLRPGGVAVIHGANFTGAITQLGGPAADQLTGTPQADALVAGAGNDRLNGSGGGDVLYGGAGDDQLVISDSTFRRVLGGRGSDTLVLTGRGMTLDLSSVADNRLEGIEAIDLSDGAHRLILNPLEVLNLSDESNSLQITLDADDTLQLGSGWSRQADTLLDGVLYESFTAANATVYATKKLALDLSFDSTTVSEKGGTVVATVSRNSLTTTDLEVLLNKSPLVNVAMPNSITIPKGKSSATFEIHAIDNDLAAGNARVTIQAMSQGLNTAVAELEVLDDDVPTLSISIGSESINERDGTTVAYISRNTPTDNALTVHVVASPAGALSFLDSLDIPAGQSTVELVLRANNDEYAMADRAITVSASADGLASGGDSLMVIDDDEPMLAFSLSAASVSESAQPLIGTITRNTSLGTALEISLSSSDGTEIVLPQKVILPAGARSITFDVAPAQDNIVDGDVVVGLVASASGFDDAKVQLTVIDADTPSVTITGEQHAISESAGTIQLQIRRNTSTAQPLEVQLSSNSPRLAIASLITIPAGQDHVVVNAQTIDDGIAAGDHLVTLTASSQGHVGSDWLLTVVDDDVASLLLTNVASSVREDQGAIPMSISRNTPVDDDLRVFLSSTSPGRFSVPSSVVILAGETTATFTANAIDDQLLDGTQSVTVTATAEGLQSASAKIEVTDYETIDASLSPSSISELSGTSVLTVIRNNTDIASAVRVTITTSMLGQIILPPEVLIEANSSSVSVPVYAINNSLLDGTRSLTLELTADGYQPSTALLQVTDHEQLALSATVRYVSEQGGSLLATVSRQNTNIDMPLVVTLKSQDTSEALVSSAVTIPAGAESADFWISAIDDAVLDAEQWVEILASADGYLSTQMRILVTDAESILLQVDRTQISENGGVATATISRSDIDSTNELQVNLTASEASGIRLPTSVLLAAGESSTSFLIEGLDDLDIEAPQTIKVTASAAGFASSSVTVELLDDDAFYPWHNPRVSFDVNDDRHVSPLDVLIVINELNTHGPGALTSRAISDFVDTSNDNFISAIDVLLVINYLNSQDAQLAEPEQSLLAVAAADSLSPSRDLNADCGVPPVDVRRRLAVDSYFEHFDC